MSCLLISIQLSLDTDSLHTYPSMRFVTACQANDVIGVKNMISEGVDINGEDICGMSGLISASIMGNSEVIRILLSCRNIKIDSKDVAGWTALHWACSLGKTESVKSFLEHPTCNKDIVEMKSESGYTAEKRAKKTGNQECVRLQEIY